MATMTATTPRRRTRTTTRAKARLMLEIGGVSYRLHPFDDDPDGRSGVEWVHTLIGPDGEPFAVLITNLYFHNNHWQTTMRDGSRHHCDRCDAGSCLHITALDQVGLL